MSDVKVLAIPIDGQGRMERDVAEMAHRFTAGLSDYYLASTALIAQPGGGRSLTLTFKKGAPTNESEKHATNPGQGLEVFYRR